MAAVDFHHNHNVLVALLRTRRELTCLIGEHGFAYHVHLGVDVTPHMVTSSFQERGLPIWENFMVIPI
jgi:hypothetical protein